MKCPFDRYPSRAKCTGTISVRRLTRAESNNIDDTDWRAFEPCSECKSSGTFYLPGMAAEARAEVLKEAP